MSHLGNGSEQDELDVMRHSAAHVLAKAVQRLYPGSKLAIGPVIEHGFYYDIDVSTRIGEADLPRIEDEMRRIVAADEPFRREEWTRERALSHYTTEDDNPYKREIIEAVPPDESLSFYWTGSDWVDLCRGPHVPSSGQIGPFKLVGVSGAYWRGDEQRPMLQRIYGTAWKTREELDHHLWQLEEAARRDHRRLGRELDLYSISPEVGNGLVLYHPRGATLRMVMEDYWRQRHREAGYQFVYTPHIGRSTLWETSGHLNWYREGMYSSIDVEDEQYYLKPMNCPFHMTIYKSRPRSYRELPLRLAELGTVYRYERSGVLAGLLRVRGFTQDDAHLICRPDQMSAEIERALDFCLSILRDYGLEDLSIELSVRDPATPDKYAGSDENWALAEAALTAAVESRGLTARRMEGEAVFYGPKIDVRIRDALGRSWQASTIQFDFNLPERFDLTYVGEDGAEHRPYMVHRALYGSIERFLALLVEHYGGAFPVWLAPVQAAVLTITDDVIDFGRQVQERLSAAGLRCQLDDRRDRISAKVRDAQLQKIPYMLVVGRKEAAEGKVAVRLRSGEDLGPRSLDEFEALAAQAIAERRLL